MIRGVATLLLVMVPAAARAQTEVVEYYATDALGSIRVVFDPNGVEVGRGDYLPFGEELSSSAGLPPERFTGQSRDGEVGLDYLNARMLQVRSGRFNAPDPVHVHLGNSQAWNRYSYGLNNPLGNVDPTGLASQPIQPDTHCDQQKGAFWCPGAMPNPGRWVDHLFDPDAYGYRPGQELAAAEAMYAESGTVWDKPPDIVSGSEPTAQALGAGAVAGVLGATASAVLRWLFGFGAAAVPAAVNLAQHEFAGGHTLAKHVGQSLRQLDQRLLFEPKLGAASTYLNLAQAQHATAQVLAANATTVNGWLAGGAANRLQIQASLQVGVVLQRGAAHPVVGQAARVILQGNGSGGYFVLTSYPFVP